MDSLYCPLHDLRLHPGNGAWSEADGQRKALIPNQRVQAGLRKTRDGFYVRQPQEDHVLHLALSLQAAGAQRRSLHAI